MYDAPVPFHYIIKLFFRSHSATRKWNPPSILAEEKKLKNGMINDSSQLSIKAMIGNVTPRLHVGLSRNYKSPKGPLHANLKWTP